MVSVDAGNAFLRRLAIKAGVCVVSMPKKKQDKVLEDFAAAQSDDISPEGAMSCLIEGRHNSLQP